MFSETYEPNGGIAWYMCTLEKFFVLHTIKKYEVYICYGNQAWHVIINKMDFNNFYL